MGRKQREVPFGGYGQEYEGDCSSHGQSSSSSGCRSSGRQSSIIASASVSSPVDSIVPEGGEMGCWMDDARASASLYSGVLSQARQVLEKRSSLEVMGYAASPTMAPLADGGTPLEPRRVRIEDSGRNIPQRGMVFEQAHQYFNENGYRLIPSLPGILLTRQERHIERALLQREANLALQRNDCREANFADYVHYDLDEYVYATPSQSMGNKGQSSRNVIEMETDGEKPGEDELPERGVVEELVSQGNSPSDVAKLADLFEHPSCIKDVEMSLIPWLREQTQKDYWRNEASLFLLCLTMAISIGNVETIFKLNSTWDGMVFLVPYLISYLFVVQPMMLLELTTGQLFRKGQSAIYEKLRKGCSGVGTAIVLLCLISGCFASSRSAAEYMLYMLDVFKKALPWRLTEEETKMCESLVTDVACEAKTPLCHFSDGQCVGNALGKAYLAYQERFDSALKNSSFIDKDLLWAMVGSYAIVAIFQILGLATFTFSASMLIILVLFLIHMQLFTTMTLEGATEFLWLSLSNWKWENLYLKGRIWSHSVRACLYEFIVGNGIYATLAARSRVGYDLSKEAIGVGLVSGYMTTIMFGVACSLIGFYSRTLKALPVDIMWMLEQDCNYILLPLGFQTTETMERTLCVLQFGCGVILMCATLAVQIEVAAINIQDVTLFGIDKIGRRVISAVLVVSLMAISLVLASRTGKQVAWFLEIAVGDLGRVFTVLITSIVVGWLYGTEFQKSEVGCKTLYVFNAVFWLFNSISSIGEVADESIYPFFWWMTRVVGIITAAVVAYKVNERDAEHRKPAKTVFWHLFFGNIEHLRAEICRITPMKKTGGLPMTILWSVCVKWFIPCMLSNTIADVLEEILAPNRVDVNINTIPYLWKMITLGIWALMVLAILIPVVLPYISANLVPKYTTIDLDRLPSCPIKHSFWAGLRPQILFGEYYTNPMID